MRNIECAAIILGSWLGGGCAEGVDDTDPRITEITENLLDAGYPEHEISVDAEGSVWVGGDARVSLEASQEMVADGDVTLRHYRTLNLVDPGRYPLICVRPVGYNERLLRALNRAIANYNELGLRFTMQVRQGDNSGCNVVIWARTLDPASGLLGRAGFPANGAPYQEIEVLATAADGPDFLRGVEVITHELGHCLGFRHTDYFDRSISCGGSAFNERPLEIGAVHVPGSPTGATRDGSLMNSCVPAAGDRNGGEFLPADERALRELYR